MENWLDWIPILAMSTLGIALTSFLLCRAYVNRLKKQVVVLQIAVSLAHSREKNEQERLAEVFDAVTSLKRSSDELFRIHRERVCEILLRGFRS